MASLGTIQFDNTSSYFSGSQGELHGFIWITTDGAAISYPIRIGDASDLLRISINSAEAMFLVVAANGLTISSSSRDASSALNKYWVEFYAQWDESRGVGDETTLKIRIWDDTPTWTGWSNSADTDDLEWNNANQPGANEVDFGATTANYHNCVIDNIEINNTLPNGWEP